MRELVHYPVIVIGAGMAGLAAAQILDTEGVKFLVIEKNAYPGGRTHTIKLKDGTIFPTGAGFMMTSYRQTRKLIKKYGLETYDLAKMDVQVYYGGKYHILTDHEPSQTLRSSLLSPSEKLHALWELLALSPKIFKADVYDTDSLVEFDGLSTYEYAAKHFSSKFARNIVDPIVYSLFGYSSKEISFAFLLSALRETFGHKHFGLTVGIDGLARRMALDLPIRFNTSVQSISKTSKYFTVVTDTGKFSAEHLIIASPGAKVSNFAHSVQGKEEQSFFARVQYKPEQFFLIETEQRLPGGEHSVFPDTEKNKICSIIHVGNNLYDIALREPIADFSSPRSEKIAKFATVWESQFGSAHKYAVQEIIEWESTLPVFYPGYLKHLAEFQRWLGRPENCKITYAGDYLQAPYIEGAVVSGQRAASRILHSLGNY